MPKRISMNPAAQAFGCLAEPEPLAGGEGRAYRCGDAVIKPVDDARSYEWFAGELSSAAIPEGLAALPRRSAAGRWIEAGWGAADFLPGRFHENRMQEKIATLRRFNRCLAGIGEPAWFCSRSSPYAEAHRLAWDAGAAATWMNGRGAPKKSGEQVDLGELRRLVEHLERRTPDLEGAPRVCCHGDASGNILFDDQRPAVEQGFLIDMTPAFAPEWYSEVLMICDSIAWHGASATDLDLIPSGYVEELAVRAVVFRLIIPLLFNPQEAEYYIEEAACFEPVIRRLG
jgi:hypothetical protein